MTGRTTAAPSATVLGALAVDPTDVVALWAEARCRFLAEDFPPYGSPAWLALHPDDPRRFAAVIDAAEKWRKYGDEEGLLQWFREASQPREPLTSRRTRAELDAAWLRVREQAAEMWARERDQISNQSRWPKVTVPGRENRT
ncbi:hypothetical protein GCM10010294_60950 [Streptomyces griseoloalbus]|uniref:DUF2742 domain-containing protein n=1 Tax=Streptomyces griseoloalbus TaxID=67303 RepID=UPI001995A2E2|nr:hypothetical protein GCM10010294_60950 [Streptomyces griseoloalbus]